MEVTQIFQEIFVKQFLSPQILNVLIGKMQIQNIIDQLIQPGSNGETALVGNVTEKHIEIDNAVLITRLHIAVGHGELIKVTQHRQIQFMTSHFRSPNISAHSACNVPDYRLSSL